MILAESDGEIIVVGEASDGDEAVRLATAVRPDVVLMDLSMPRVDGLEATRRLREAGVESRVLILTSFADGEGVRDAVRAGVTGYLMKDVLKTELLAAIRLAADGVPTLHPRAQQHLMRGIAEPETPSPFMTLTPRERDVLALLARGESNKRIRGGAEPEHRHGEGIRQRDLREARRRGSHAGGLARRKTRRDAAEHDALAHTPDFGQGSPPTAAGSPHQPSPAESWPAVGCRGISGWCFLMAPAGTALNPFHAAARCAAFPILTETCPMSRWPYRIAREQRVIRTMLVTLSAALLVAACYDSNNSDNNGPTEPAPPTPTIVTGSGDIAPKVDEYRALLGEPRNGGTVPGPAASGRREVNWDGVNAANLNTNTFPGDFFANTTKLGMLMTTRGRWPARERQGLLGPQHCVRRCVQSVQPDEDVRGGR